MVRLADTDKQELENRRRDQIVAAAVSQWLEQGYDATSVAAIAHRAGVAKGTVYLYFDSKASILTEVIARYSLAPDIEAFLSAMEGVAPRRAVRFLVRGIWTALHPRIEVVRLLVREITIRPEHARTFVENVVLPTNQALADYLDRSADRGELDLLGIDSFVAARALVGALTIFLFTQTLFGGAELRPIDDDTIVDTVTRLFTNALKIEEA